MPELELKWILNHGKLRLSSSPVLYHCEPIWSWRVDSLSDFALLLILGGRGNITIETKPFELRKGICFLLKPGAEIEAQQNPSYPLFLFLARFEILDTEGNSIPPSQLDSVSKQVFIRNVRNLEALAELIVGCGNHSRKDESLLTDALNMLIRLIVEEAKRDAGAFNSQAYEALQAIENDLAHKWKVAELAKIAGHTPSKFARAFRRMMNEPPIQYVIRRRMDEAKRQIQQSSLSIDEIAINLGYNDLSLFRELFRKRTGLFPESIRENRGF